MATCGYERKRNGDKHEPVPSDYNLAFFQYRGPGSPAAQEYCKHCPYTVNAHRYGPFYNPGRCPSCREYDPFEFIGNNRFRCLNCTTEYHAVELKAKHKPDHKNHDFEPHGAFDYDKYYCGCWGWD